MNLATWLSIVAICCLGAMSPGPSLAVVMRHTLAGGRPAGISAALAHGLGVGIYAALCVSGLAFLILASPRLFAAFQWAGAAYLAWMGIRGLMAKPQPAQTPSETPTTGSAARDGFMVAFLNPKIAVFFVALFSQVIGPDSTAIAKVVYASTAMVIDAAWYLLVAWLFSNPRWLSRLQKNSVWLERLFGAVLLGLAARLVWINLAGGA